jgi:FAD binding domain.
VLAQPAGAAFQVYDQTGVGLFRRGENYAATMFEAPTIAELAKKVGIEPAVLVHTVDEFNAACRTDVTFDPRSLDGKSTVGISPPKSNWAEPIVRGPFRAYPITAGITFTFGGLQVDTKAQVINTGHKPIHGCSHRATWSACSSTIIPPAPAKRVMPCSAISPAAAPPQR